jgi:hypothetical protein
LVISQNASPLTQQVVPLERRPLMRCSPFLFPILLLAAFSLTLQADTIYVPGDYATIMAGIDACVDGDSVLVADSTYATERISFGLTSGSL